MLQYDETLSRCDFKFNLPRYTKAASKVVGGIWNGPAAGNIEFPTECKGQGLTLVHFSAQPEPFLTQHTPQSPPITTYYPLTPPKHPPDNP